MLNWNFARIPGPGRRVGHKDRQPGQSRQRGPKSMTFVWSWIHKVLVYINNNNDDNDNSVYIYRHINIYIYMLTVRRWQNWFLLFVIQILWSWNSTRGVYYFSVAAMLMLRRREGCESDTQTWHLWNSLQLMVDVPRWSWIPQHRKMGCARTLDLEWEMVQSSQILRWSADFRWWE